MKLSSILFSICATGSLAHFLDSVDEQLSLAAQSTNDTEISKERQAELDLLWGNDWPFTGINTFAHLPHTKCLLRPNEKYDIAVIGVPFDTAVSYRPGTRFGPRALRAASQRQYAPRGFNTRGGINPYQNWARIIDCGDIPVTPMDNDLALRQMTQAYDELLAHDTVFRPKDEKEAESEKNSVTVPRLVSLGGDHSIILPALRALHKIYGPISVIHFDAHLDTWLPRKYPTGWESKQSDFTHGTMFWMASEEGLLSNGSCIHAGLRTRLSGIDWEDYEDDEAQGFARIHSDEIFYKGIDHIVETITARVGTKNPVYISVDIDVLDPGFAPGTGTPEAGGWQTRELISLIRKLEHLNIVGADLVEVSPSFDHAEITALAGSQVVYELITSMVKTGRPAKY